VPSFNITDFGAVGDGKTNNAAAIQHAIDLCYEKGGGRVIVPTGGIFVSGPFEIKSFVNLHIEANATLRASTDESLYTEAPFKNWAEGSMWLSAMEAQHISITGTGTIDGSGTAFMESEEPTHYNYKFVNGIDRRPHLLTLIGCNNVTIRDVTFANAAYWCVHPAGCQDVLIHGVRILNSLKVRNCDGIDIDHCRNVRVSNCYIESADDCICIKNRRDYAEYGPCENITISDCILTSTSCALKLGSENMDAMRNIIVDSCVITASNRGLGIQNRDEGTIENVLFSNIVIESRLFDDVWWGKAEPIYITAFKRAPGTPYRFPDGETEGKIGKVRNIRFSNILCSGENGVYISGCPESRIEEVLMENVRVEINKTTDYRGGMYDRRPCDVEGIIHHATAGVLIHEADDIVLRHCRVVWGPNRSDYFGSALEACNVTELEVENFKGAAAHPERDPAIQVTPASAIRYR
jgi:polygalacturonase